MGLRCQNDLPSIKAELAQAERVEAKVPLTRMLSTTLGDVAPELRNVSKLLADIPVLSAAGVVAAGVGSLPAGYAVSGALNELTHNADWEANVDKYGLVDGVGHILKEAG